MRNAISQTLIQGKNTLFVQSILLQTMHLFPITRRSSLFVKELVDHLKTFEKLTFLSLGCPQPGGAVHFEIFHFYPTGNHIEVIDERKVLDPDFAKSLFNPVGPVQLPPEISGLLGKDGRQSYIPLSLGLFTSPIGFLLLSDQESLTTNLWRPGISALLMEALQTELDEYFTDEVLLRIADTETLCHQFNQILLPWLAPATHVVSNGTAPQNAENYFNLWPGNRQTWEIVVRNGNQEYCLAYELPAIETNHTHSHVVWSPLQRYFAKNLFGRWERLHAPVPDRETLIAKFNQIFTLIENLGKDIARISYAAVEQEDSTLTPPKPFSFYLPDGKKDWVILFKGAQVNMLSNAERNVGLEAIRILLQHPERRFSALEIYGKHRFAKGPGSSQEFDSAENKRRKKELKSELDFYQDSLKQLSKPEDIAKVWRIIFELLMVLIEHEPNNNYYYQQYFLARDKSKIIKADSNFDKKEFKIFQAFKPTGAHNANTSLKKGIDAAIAQLDHPELKTYLEATLILKRRGEHEPFKYVPGLSNDATLRHAPDWDTGDPVL